MTVFTKPHSQVNALHIFTQQLFSLHFNFILSSSSGYSFRFPDQNSVCVSHLPQDCYLYYASNVPEFHYPNNTMVYPKVSGMAAWSEY